MHGSKQQGSSDVRGDKAASISSRFAALGSDDKPARLGLMGGTFDPIHVAHLVIAERARAQFDLDAVLFIPTGNPVFKKDIKVTPAQVRLDMVKKAVSSNAHFDACPLEALRTGDTFTIDTLRTLRDHYPDNVSFYFIIGADAAQYLWKWRASEEVASLTKIVVARRAGVGLSEEQLDRIMQAAAFDISYVDVPALDIASSNLRARRAQGKTIRYLVPEQVFSSITELGLYLEEGSSEHVQAPGPVDSQSHNLAIEDGVLGLRAATEDALGEAFFEARKAQLAKRVKPKRFTHVMGVVKAACELAKAYGVDVPKARLGALLHDWDKGFSDEEIRARARVLDVAVDGRIFDDMPQLLHGLTAASALSRAYPQLPADIAQAIARHTAGACNMTDLDMVVYIADVIEENRDFPGVESLRKLVGNVSLEELFVKTFSQSFANLLDRGQAIHPQTVDIWNYYAMRRA